MYPEVAELFRSYLSQNHGPDGMSPDYGVQVTGISEDRTLIKLTLTFKNGCSYCCGEIGCHFQPNWQDLRSVAATLGVSLGSPLAITIFGVVEEDSCFDVNPSFGMSAENEAYTYSQTFIEQDTSG